MNDPGGVFLTAAKRLLKGPLGIGLLAVIAGSVIFNFPVGVVAALVTGMVVYGIMVAHEANRDVPFLIGMPHDSELDTSSRMRLKPMLKLQTEIHDMIESHENSVVISAVSVETLTEVDAVLLRAVELLQARRSVMKLLEGVHRSRSAVAELESKLEREQDERVRASTESALAARREELLNFEQLELAVKRLDANIDEADSTLAELRSQIALIIAQPRADAVEESRPRLSDLTRRLQQLSDTMEESIEAISTRGW